MKVLMLGWELPPRNSGGLGVACYHLCRHLADAGVAIDFVMPYALPPEQHIDFMHVHGAQPVISEAPFFGAYTEWSQQLRRQQAMYRRTVEHLLTQSTYDAIHAHDWLTFEAGVHAKKLTGIPLVAHVHSTEYDRCGQTTGNPLVHEIEQTSLQFADRVVAVSNATKQVLVARYGLRAQTIDVVYSATDPALLHATTNHESTYLYLQRMRARGYKVVVSLGRLTIQKGLTFLLHAAQRAIKLNPKLLFLVVGDGEQRDELIALSAELGISENVIFTGFLRGARWRDAYAAGDMFVMSSVSEPYGLTALEAAGLGTPVLLTKQSGVSEVLRHTLRFDFWDTAKLADYIVNLAQQNGLRDTLAANARREVAGISWPKAARQLSAIYQLVGARA
jgi:glycogen(starch) synthase